jgi:aspartate-semialdehyde dehydrogenase
MKKNIAVLFGGTGLTGSHLLDMLINDSSFESVVVVSRKKIINPHEKTSNKIIDFSNYKEIESCITEESIVFSCIGTTQADVKGDKKSIKKLILILA